jgi:heat shock protein HslJ
MEMKNLRMWWIIMALVFAGALGACRPSGPGEPFEAVPTDEPPSAPTDQPTDEPITPTLAPTEEPMETLTPEGVVSNELVGTSWELAEINGEVPVPGTAFTLTFQEAELGGTACNTYGGPYTADEGTIEVGEIISTMMACMEPEGTMDQESAYFDALSEATRYELSEEQLVLGTESTPSALVFTEPPGMQTYQDTEFGFEVSYPDSGSPAQMSDDSTVRIDLPFAADTNLQDKYLQINVHQDGETCASPLTEGHSPDSLETETVTIGGIEWTKVSGGDAGAGNFYDFTAYSATEGDTCVTLTFVLHSTNAQNYSPPLEEFDYEAESAVFEEIMESFHWLS